MIVQYPRRVAFSIESHRILHQLWTKEICLQLVADAMIGVQSPHYSYWHNFSMKKPQTHQFERGPDLLLLHP